MTQTLKNDEVLSGRFAPCTSGLRLLITLAQAARRATTGGRVVSPAGLKFCDAFSPSPMHKKNLTRHEIYRGKISLQTKSTHLEERTHQRQVNE
jgi:hypothetical protein